MFIKIVILFYSFCLILGCSRDVPLTKTKSNDFSKSTLSTINSSIQAVFMRGKIEYVGDFTKNVKFKVETNVNKAILTGDMKCSQNGDNSIKCVTDEPISSLLPGIYRLVITNEGGVLGSDLFEVTIKHDSILVTIDSESTGLYVLALLINKSGFTEAEIYERIRTVLGADKNQDYDLEPTLSRLFNYYNGEQNSSVAINKMIKLITENKPFAEVRSNGVTETLKPLF